MSSEGKSATDRLKELFGFAPEIAKVLATTVRNIGDQFDVELEMADLDWTDPDNTFLMATILKAFADAKLDPNLQWHWRLLLYLFARAHYNKTKPKKWNSMSYCKLLHAEAVIKNKYPNLPKKEILSKLARMPQYRKVGTEQLRKMLRHARDPNRNVIVNLIAESGLEVLREFGQKHNVPGFERDVSALKPVLVKEVIDNIAKRARSQKRE
jgi:hypothetical protein